MYHLCVCVIKNSFLLFNYNLKLDIILRFWYNFLQGSTDLTLLLLFHPCWSAKVVVAHFLSSLSGDTDSNLRLGKFISEFLESLLRTLKCREKEIKRVIFTGGIHGRKRRGQFTPFISLIVINLCESLNYLYFDNIYSVSANCFLVSFKVYILINIDIK